MRSCCWLGLPSPKIVVNATCWHTHLAENGIRQKEIPDVALDKHTLVGKRRGRGWAHFFDESSLLADRETGELSPAPVLPDPYREKVRAILVKEPTAVPTGEHNDPKEAGRVARTTDPHEPTESDSDD
jgi:hypothetical protein